METCSLLLVPTQHSMPHLLQNYLQKPISSSRFPGSNPVSVAAPPPPPGQRVRPADSDAKRV